MKQDAVTADPAEQTHQLQLIDAWGRPVRQAFDGHSAWGCNNHECEQHSPTLYGKSDTRTGTPLTAGA